MSCRVHSLPAASNHPHPKSGQALLESFGIIILLCLILFGLIQYVLLLTATEVIQYSADASVRARVVGMNDFMVYKVSRVALIPNAGRMTTPSGYAAGRSWRSNRVGDMWRWQAEREPGERLGEIWRNPGSAQYVQIEYPRIPFFLGSRRYGEMLGYLDYERWEDINAPRYTSLNNGVIEVTMEQDYPIFLPFARAFMEDDEIRILKKAQLANHADFYLE